MSIKILTIKEAAKTKIRCKEYGEVCEIELGVAKQDYYCDNSDDEIPEGTPCAAVMVLPNKSHPNYEHQKAMLKSYLK